MEYTENITAVKRWKKVRVYTALVMLDPEGGQSTLVDIRHSVDGVDALQWSVYWRIKYGCAESYKVGVIGRDIHVPTGTNCKDGERLMLSIYVGDTPCKEFNRNLHKFTLDKPRVYTMPTVKFAQV